MATTDARPGFKLPWGGTDRSESNSTDAPEAPPASTDEQPAATAEPVDAAPEPIVNDSSPDSSDPWRLGATPAVVADQSPRRKPNKLMADLTRAMQTAAESARDETLTRLQADAKSYIETVHTRSATEAEQLRTTADTDIVGIREWSKSEISRIREETDQKVTDRKARLETDVEQHAARIEARIEQVQHHVADFETEMAGFFERLLAEEDPSLLAAMAESLPEPPTFEDFDNLPEPQLPAPAAATYEPEAVAEAEAVAETEAVAKTEAFVEAPTEEWTQSDGTAEPQAEAVAESFDAPAPEHVDDPEAAFQAIQDAAEAVDNATSDETGYAEAPAADEPSFNAEGYTEAPAEGDPRLDALGFGSEVSYDGEQPADGEFAQVAEADAENTPGDDIPTIADDALAARLAGLVPGEGEAADADLRTTRVVVTGLISVASIASFKRHLGKIEGVASVGVSSGPDGEFVFAVSHGSTMDLTLAIPGLPGFAAQVTAVTDDTVSVAARDPETES